MGTDILDSGFGGRGAEERGLGFGFLHAGMRAPLYDSAMRSIRAMRPRSLPSGSVTWVLLFPLRIIVERISETGVSGETVGVSVK